MRLFYMQYPICQTVSGKLSWSHYCELLTVSDVDKREFYEKECIDSKWSVRELKRQIESSLFERLLLSKGNTNKETVIEISQNGIEEIKAEDVIKDPYVFEFLGIPENKAMAENDLEAALVRQIEDFLLELGKGFMFVGTQQRVPVGNTKRYVEYALGGLSNKIFASKYILYMPDKQQLISQVERVMKKWHNI